MTYKRKETYQSSRRSMAGVRTQDFANETIEEKLLRRSEILESGCRQWIGALYNGYGYVALPRTQHPIRAHRVAYRTWVGPIPDGLTIDHLCRNRACIEPTHLEAVPAKVNILRGDTLAARNKAKTHCNHGHPFEGDNLRITKTGERVCRACQERAKQAWLRRKGLIA